jgi:two-component system chemotaxis sensor kinase CheA
VSGVAPDAPLAALQNQGARFIVDASELKQIVDIFIHETGDHLSQFEDCLRALEHQSPAAFPSEKMLRTVRNLRGSSAALGFTDISAFTLSLENCLLAMKKHDLRANAEVIRMLRGCKEFIAEHAQCLRAGKPLQKDSRELQMLMERLSDPAQATIRIELPRPLSAGDIWFVGDDLKAVLFEMPETSVTGENGAAQGQTGDGEFSVGYDSPESLEARRLDAKLSSIQAEIARLTVLAAQVNRTTIESFLTKNETQPPPPDTEQSGEAAGFSKGTGPVSDQTNPAGEVATVAAATPSADQEETKDILNTAENPAAALPVEEEDGLRERSEPSGSEPVKSRVQIHASAAALTETPAQTAIPSSAGGLTEEKVRLGTDKIDKLSDLIGELIILQGIFEGHSQEFQSPLLQKSVAQMAKVLREVQDLSSQFRLIRVRPLFSKLQRVVQRCAMQLNKDVVIETAGEETDIDKVLVDHLVDPLISLIKFSLDYGIEPVGDRIKSGKPAKARIQFTAVQQTKSIIIELRDDGAGLDPQKIKTQAVQRGLISPFEKISDNTLRELIFHAGFFPSRPLQPDGPESPALDEVRDKIHALQGRIEIESQAGTGTCFRLHFPLVIRVIDGFITKLGRERFVIPKNQVTETIRPQEADLYKTHGDNEMLNLRGQAIPLFYLPALLGKKPPATQNRTSFEGVALVFEDESNRKFAVAVDDILAQQQVVLKKLGAELQNIDGLDGAAILGDGKPALVLDVRNLVRSISEGRKISTQLPDGFKAA